MKINLILILWISFILVSLSCCQKEDPEPESKENPFNNEEIWNGFIMNGQEYITPNAIIEIWGENLDSLSSDYDISFTDGNFDYATRKIIENNILLYFDANSSSLNNFSPGTYQIEKTNERKPGNIVEAYIQITTATSVKRYPILSGTVTVKVESGFYSIQYELETNVDKVNTIVRGNYNGNYTFIDQTVL